MDFRSVIQAQAPAGTPRVREFRPAMNVAPPAAWQGRHAPKLALPIDPAGERSSEILPALLRRNTLGPDAAPGNRTA
jgi:hypothetical protein